MRKSLFRLALALFATSAFGLATGLAAEVAAGHRLTVDDTIAELLDNAASRAVLQRQVPAIVESPEIAQAREQTLRGIAPFAPTLLTSGRLQEIDEELARTPGAVTTAPARPVQRRADPQLSLSFQTIRLWDGRAPDSRGDTPQDMPTLTVVGPDGTPSCGTAVIVAPGGAYVGLSSGHEGRQVADWFAAHGVTAFVLSYRLTPYGYHHPTQLHDAQRAIRWVRAHADEFGVDRSRIGMIGFSAGGHLTAMAETAFDSGNPSAADPVERVSSRPDFAVLGYAVIDIGDGVLRKTGIAGSNPTVETLRELNPALHVTRQVPPTFIFHTSTDELVPARNATLFYDALRAANVPAELHIFAEGRHGLGLAMTDPSLSAWPDLLQGWLEGIGMIGPKTIGAH